MTATTALRSKLSVYAEHAPGVPLVTTSDGAEIARLLREIGVRFERWETETPLSEGADQDAILRAYSASIARVQRDGGYGTVDTVRLQRGAPNAAEMRAKFLSEHTHTEDEVRFFVEGSGAFYLHVDGKVFQAVCVRGDLISVPAETTHWFDMGPDPEFTAVRFFDRPEGWVGNFTGSDIATRFPSYE